VTESLNLVPFVSVEHMMKLVLKVGVERFMAELAGYIEEDFRRWELFDKTPRVASHSAEGVIELMPTSDGRTYGFKYVNGHPKNTAGGRQTVTAFGVLADVATGYPVLISEMTILTALRTAATSALAAKYLAPAGARCMALIGNGAQAEFQAVAFRALTGIDRLRLYDIDADGEREGGAQPRGDGVRDRGLREPRGGGGGRGGHHHGDGGQGLCDDPDRQHGRVGRAHQRGRRRLPGQDRAAPRHPDALGDLRGVSGPDPDRGGDPAARGRSPGGGALGGDRRPRAGAAPRGAITLFDSVGFATEDFSACATCATGWSRGSTRSSTCSPTPTSRGICSGCCCARPGRRRRRGRGSRKG
jgi:hypothetical protein